MSLFEFATESPWWTLVYLLLMGEVAIRVAYILNRRMEKR